MKYLITGGSGFIGTNLINYIMQHDKKKIILNLDIHEPRLKNHFQYWSYCDINDYDLLKKKLFSFKPDFIVHLAAETNVKYKKIADYKTNIQGVENICRIVNKIDTLKRIIFTSTQYVHQFHGFPTKDDEYFPFTVYGESKAISEKIIRNYKLNKEWLIIRPTNIYGPFNDIYTNGLFKIIDKGLYFHPKVNVLRSYGYVGNIAFQVYSLLKSKKEDVNRKTFYVSDEPILLLDFVQKIHKELGRNKVKKLPVWLFKVFAHLGDVFNAAGVSFPMNSIRLKNMVTPNPVDISKTIGVVGKSPYSFESAIHETIKYYLNSRQH